MPWLSFFFFFFSSRRRHTRYWRDWSSDVCSSDLGGHAGAGIGGMSLSGYPVRTPVVDLVEIGAGGGSIAWVDSGGLLRVGPQSAGADPGAVCYGHGGVEPTVTDANVV